MTDEASRASFKKRWLILVVSVVVLVGAILLLVKTLATQSSAQLSYNYAIQSTADYQVTLHDNEFYDESTHSANRQYLADLVKEIEIDFKSQYKSSQLADLHYDYEVTANVRGLYARGAQNADTLWERDFDLDNAGNGLVTGENGHTFNETVKIHFDTYRQEAIDFIEEYRIRMDAFLEVTLILNYEILIEGQTVLENQSVTVKIPLTDPTFEISVEASEPVEQAHWYEIVNETNLLPVVIGAALAVVAVGMIILQIAVLIAAARQISDYQRALQQIMKNYEDIIVVVESKPDYNDLNLLDIKEFSDMVNLNAELRIPVVFWEKALDREAWFMVITPQTVYRYILRDGRPQTENDVDELLRSAGEEEVAMAKEQDAEPTVKVEDLQDN